MIYKICNLYEKYLIYIFLNIRIFKFNEITKKNNAEIVDKKKKKKYLI